MVKKKYFFLSVILSLSYNLSSQIRFIQLKNSVDIPSVEECIGQDIVKHFFNSGTILHGNPPKYLSRILLKFDTPNEINEIRFLSNRNPSLTIKDFERCLIPHLNLIDRKVQKQQIAISLYFDEKIQKDNDYYFFTKDLKRVKNSSIQSYEEKRKYKLLGYDFDVREEKFIKCSQVLAEKIMHTLIQEIDIMIERYKNEYELCQTNLERKKLSNKVRKNFSKEIRNKYLELLSLYLEED